MIITTMTFMVTLLILITIISIIGYSCNLHRNGRSPSPWRGFMKNLSKMQPAGRKLSAKDEWYPFRWAARNGLDRLKGMGTTASRPDRSLPRKGQRHRNREEMVHYFWQ